MTRQARICTDLGHVVNALYFGRQRRNLSQRDLGKLIGTSQSCISEWETGKVAMTLESFMRAADALDYDVLLIERPRP